MYKMWYKAIMPGSNNTAILCMHDTDSFLFQHEAESRYAFYEKIKDVCDFSNHPLTSPVCDSSQKGELGKLKDETADKNILENVNLVRKAGAFLDELTCCSLFYFIRGPRCTAFNWTTNACTLKLKRNSKVFHGRM